MNLVLLFIGFAILYTLQLFITRSIVLKLIVITYLFLVSSAIYFSFDSYKGWPTDEKVNKAFLIKVHIVEPTPESKGGIYIWTIPETQEQNIIATIFGYSVSNMPRAYIIPYSNKAQKEFTEAQKKLEEGMVIILNDDSPQKQGEQTGEGASQTKQDGDGNAADSGQEYEGPRISIVSPDQVMRK